MMTRNELKTRIAVLLLAAVMALPVPVFTCAEAYAVSEDGQDVQVEAVEAEEEGGGSDETSETPETVPETGAAANDAAGNEFAVEGKAPDEDPDPEPADIDVSAAGKDRVIEASWTHVGTAEYYVVTLSAQSEVVDTKTIDAPAKDAVDTTLEYSSPKVDQRKPYTIEVRAYRDRTGEEKTENGEADAEPVLVAYGKAGNVYAYVTAETNRQDINGTKRTPYKLGINLRTLLGEKHGGYSVVQGGVSDGTYAYYLMVSSSNQKGRVLKVRMSDNAVVAKSAVINICHGNGMALDTVNHRLVVVGREGRRNQLTIIDVGTGESDVPNFTKYVDVKYGYSGNWTGNKGQFDSYGLSAISYIEKYDCYLALQRSTHELLVLDQEFNVIGTIHTRITAKYPGTYQAMDADERYVYLLLSPYNSSQPHNTVLALEWHGDKVLDYTNGRTKFIRKAWTCGSDGTPSAVIRTNTPYEAENLYHVDQGNGTSRVYLSEYFNNPQYHWVTKKKKVKVKWKKVRKKVKVKRKGKYKYIWKKVWKYKTKTKKVRVWEVNYLNRDNYVYDLGVM